MLGSLVMSVFGGYLTDLPGLCILVESGQGVFPPSLFGVSALPDPAPVAFTIEDGEIVSP